ncbi:MAG: RNA polymerase sigma factor [Rhodobacteraceae bacterium]|nr:RNA polymerase sigma factor [Paracoccaceae bacterium]
MTPHRAYPARRPGDDRPEDVPEDVLIALARNRDEAAVRELVRRCNRQLFRAARAILHDDAEAEDVVQAAYVTGFTRLDEFRGESGLATWLTRIAMNEAYARLRRRARIVNIAEYRSEAATHPDRTADTMTSPPETPEFETGRNEVRRFLERAIDALPEPLRLTYMLRDVQDMPTREVAELLGINPITVKTRLLRARRRLRREVRQNLAPEFSAIFPFDGARCAGMADRVIRALRP